MPSGIRKNIIHYIIKPDMKLSLYTYFLILLTVFTACRKSKPRVGYTAIAGETMGTYYHIKYNDKRNLKPAVDSELVRLNNELSTYIPQSTISKFNKSTAGITIPKGDLYKNILKAREIYRLSDGYYDPTVMPLVNYWGFGYKKHKKIENVDTQKVKEILTYVGMDKISIIPKGKDSILLKKAHPKVELDLSSIAKGYGVDKVCELLSLKGINDYLVEIGGEVRCSGKAPSGGSWTIGINTPDEKAAATEYIYKIKLDDKAVATSGNYRNFYKKNGHKYGHTINPKTGFPEQTGLLSASVIAGDCMTADALATACMASGTTRAKNIIKNNDTLDGILIYLDENKKMAVWNSMKKK